MLVVSFSSVRLRRTSRENLTSCLLQQSMSVKAATITQEACLQLVTLDLCFPLCYRAKIQNDKTLATNRALLHPGIAGNQSGV